MNYNLCSDFRDLDRGHKLIYKLIQRYPNSTMKDIIAKKWGPFTPSEKSKEEIYKVFYNLHDLGFIMKQTEAGELRWEVVS